MENMTMTLRKELIQAIERFLLTRMVKAFEEKINGIIVYDVESEQIVQWKI